MSFRHRSMFFFSSSYHSDDEVCTERQSYLLHTSESDMACRPLLHLKYQLTAMISKVRATFSHTIIIIIDGHCCFLWCYIIHYLLISWCIHWTTTTTTASYLLATLLDRFRVLRLIYYDLFIRTTQTHLMSGVFAYEFLSWSECGRHRLYRTDTIGVLASVRNMYDFGATLNNTTPIIHINSLQKIWTIHCVGLCNCPNGFHARP